MNLHELVLDHLRESGFNVDAWKFAKSLKWTTGLLSHRMHKYNIIPGIARLIILEKKKGGTIKIEGVPGFDVIVSIEDPQSLETIEKNLHNLYIWMKNINSNCVKELLDESQGFCSGTDVGNS